MSVSGGSSSRHVGLQCVLVSDQTCRSQTKHVSLQWVFDQPCRSLMGHAGFRWVSDDACQGLPWVSAQACRSLI